jgi:hypothetical protein
LEAWHEPDNDENLAEFHIHLPFVPLTRLSFLSEPQHITPEGGSSSTILSLIVENRRGFGP